MLGVSGRLLESSSSSPDVPSFPTLSFSRQVMSYPHEEERIMSTVLLISVKLTSSMSALVLLSSGSLNSVYLIKMEFMLEEAYW